MSRRGRSHYASHIQQSQRVTGAPKRTYLRGLYPEFFARERMMEREEKLRWIHKIGRATGLDPVTGRKYREAKQDTPWYPKSGAAKTKKGRAAQETKVGFGGPKRRRQKFEGDEGAGPPPPDLAVRGDVPRVKVEEQFSPSELAMMRPPAAMSAEQQAAYMETLQAQRRVAVPMVDPSREAPATAQALEVDEPKRKRLKPTAASVLTAYAPGTVAHLDPAELLRRARLMIAPRIKPRFREPREIGTVGARPQQQPDDFPGAYGETIQMIPAQKMSPEPRLKKRPPKSTAKTPWLSTRT